MSLQSIEEFFARLAIDVVLRVSTGEATCALFLARRDQPRESRYAVCRLSVTTQIITAPNYQDPALARLTLTAPLEPHALMALLHWTDHRMALSRFNELKSPSVTTAATPAAAGHASEESNATVQLLHPPLR
jgi:hypothetical protein